MARIFSAATPSHVTYDHPDGPTYEALAHRTRYRSLKDRIVVALETCPEHAVDGLLDALNTCQRGLAMTERKLEHLGRRNLLP